MRIRSQSWLQAAGLSFCLLATSLAEAQTFEEGYQSYMRNQFPVAEFQFRSALKKAKTREDKAFILKFIGICQFMRGDKKSSASTFTEALNHDRNLSIDEEEVLEPGVVSFFAVIKTRWQNSPEGLAAAKQPSAAPSIPKPTLKPSAPVAVKAPTPAPEEKKALPLVEEKKASKEQAKEPTKSASKKKKSKDGRYEDGDRMFSAMHFLPFGLGQFHNESYLLGTALGLGQIYGLYQFQTLSQQIKDEKDQNATVSANPNILQDRKDAFLTENNKYIDGLQSDKSNAASLFAVLYLGGVVQSLIMAPKFQGGPEDDGDTSRRKPQKSFRAAYLPQSKGGSYWVQWQYQWD